MSHASAHANDTVHGYIVAHLKPDADVEAAVKDVDAIVQVRDIGSAAGALLIYVEGRGKHGPQPDVAWHNQLEAIETRVQNLPSRPNSYFSWTEHY